MHSKINFDHFSTSSFGLLTEAFFLASKINRMVDLACGFVWAAIRCKERREAFWKLPNYITSEYIESTYIRLHEPSSNYLPSDMGQVEQFYQFNPPVVIACDPQCQELDVVTPGQLLATILSAHNFTFTPNMPLRQAGIDLRQVVSTLRTGDGYIAGTAIDARGQINQHIRPLYNMACRRAAKHGAWMLCGNDLRDEINLDTISGISSFTTIDDAAALMKQDGLRPWGPSACKDLGIAWPALEV